jgi:hypothetical protein
MAGGKACRSVSGRIYLIRTPIGQIDDLLYGGPMRIKIGRGRLVYAGFTSRMLARKVEAYWSLPASHVIEPWEDAIAYEPEGGHVTSILLFRDESDFRAWLQQPESFDVDGHLISLHAAAISRVRSAAPH